MYRGKARTQLLSLFGADTNLTVVDTGRDMYDMGVFALMDVKMQTCSSYNYMVQPSLLLSSAVVHRTDALSPLSLSLSPPKADLIILNTTILVTNRSMTRCPLGKPFHRHHHHSVPIYCYFLPLAALSNDVFAQEDQLCARLQRCRRRRLHKPQPLLRLISGEFFNLNKQIFQICNLSKKGCHSFALLSTSFILRGMVHSATTTPAAL